MTYKASLDKIAKGVTIGVTLFFVIPITLSLITIVSDQERLVPILIIIGLLLIYFGAFVFRPVNYQLTDGQLIIHRMSGDVKIERSQIKSLQLLDKEKLKGTIRTFGVGGLFGYYGKFVNSTLGSMTWFATRMDKTILIVTNTNKKIIITPDEREKLIADYESR